MNNIEHLLSKRWILKKDDPERYYQIKDHIRELRTLFQDKVAYPLIVHPQFIKLDKIPGKAEPWMGITAFQDIVEYRMFMYILMYLEDKEIEEQFIMSYLTEFIQIKMEAGDGIWLNYKNRKALVNVLKYCVEQGLIVLNDGNSESFVQNQQSEALYENTGLSRYFVRTFTMDIFNWKSPEDVIENSWSLQEQDKGMLRTQRVYRRLLLSCGIYRENEENDDFTYIRRYRKRIENDLQNFFPSSFQVYGSSAYLIPDEDVRIGQVFPKANALDELVLLCCLQIRKGIKNGDYQVGVDEIYKDTLSRIQTRFKLVINKNIDYLPVTYRKKKTNILVEEVIARFVEIGFASIDEDDIYFYPVCAKISGEFGGKTND